MPDPTSKRIQKVRNWDEVPDFASELEELDYLANHGLAENFFQPPLE